MNTVTANIPIQLPYLGCWITVGTNHELPPHPIGPLWVSQPADIVQWLNPPPLNSFDQYSATLYLTCGPSHMFYNMDESNADSFIYNMPQDMSLLTAKNSKIIWTDYKIPEGTPILFISGGFKWVGRLEFFDEIYNRMLKFQKFLAREQEKTDQAYAKMLEATR